MNWTQVPHAMYSIGVTTAHGILFTNTSININNKSQSNYEMNEPNSKEIPFPGPFGFPGMSDPLVLVLQNISNKLSIYGSPAYCALGILGNLFCCLILALKRPWSHTASTYLMAILVSDTAYLVNLLIGWMANMGVAIYKHGGMCHFAIFLSHGSMFLSVWYLVCLTVDGFIRLVYPEKIIKMCTITRANVVIFALAAVAIAVFLNISITFGTVGAVAQCAPLKPFLQTLQTLFKIDIFLNAALPDIAILYLLVHIFFSFLIKDITAVSCNVCGQQDQGESNNIRITSELMDRESKMDYKKFFFLYLIISLALNTSSHVLRIYYTIYGLLYPDVPLTMREFIWQQVFIHSYYLRCCLHIFLLLLFSHEFRAAVYSSGSSLVTTLGKLCQQVKNIDKGDTQDNNQTVNEDETETSLLKESNTTTPV